MIVDCGECLVRGDACRDCVVTVLLGEPGMPGIVPEIERDSGQRINLEQEEREAMAVLAEEGLIPRLRLVTTALPMPVTRSDEQGSGGGSHATG